MKRACLLSLMFLIMHCTVGRSSTHKITFDVLVLSVSLLLVFFFLFQFQLRGCDCLSVKRKGGRKCSLNCIKISSYA